MHRITVGAWRDDRTAPMQVVSGPVGRERVHFQAPAAGRLEDEVRRFLESFNADASTEPVLKAALAHLWFVTIRPFDDGNGPIARAIADMSLARSEGSSQRFYSMSAQIREERGEYYGILERTQKGTMDVTPWMAWFLGCLTRAIEGAQAALSDVSEKARYWENVGQECLVEELAGCQGRFSNLVRARRRLALSDLVAQTPHGFRTGVGRRGVLENGIH